MANGNRAVIQEMREIVKSGRSIDVDTRDQLLFTAVIDIYDKLEALQPALTFYRIGLWVASGLGVAIIGLIGGILTGRVEIVFK